MKKNIYFIISVIAAALLIFSIVAVSSVRVGGATEKTTTISEAYIPSETTLLESSTSIEVTTEEATTREESTTQSNETSTSRVENHPTTTTEPTTQAPKPTTDKSKYPVATEVWNYMKALGWSDAVCAGIMGNMMAEVGGHTLNLRYDAYDKNKAYYGLCQWSGKYYPQIQGTDLKTQCDFLRDTIKKQIDIYGKRYASGMNYKEFLKLEDPKEVALCFAIAYERCSSATYSVRQTNAVKAYDYFVG